MQIGKYRLNPRTLNGLYHRHIRPLWDHNLHSNSQWQNKFIVFVNNFCDLQCFSCNALCDKPIGSNPFRWQKHITPLKDIELFLDRLDGYRPEHWIDLSGGEATLCRADYLQRISELCHSHNRPVSLLTNGARLTKLDPKWFDFIHIDEHIVNEEKVNGAINYLKEQKYPRYQVIQTKKHRNLELQRTGNVTKGLRCEAWLQSVSLWRETVYPCCMSPFLDGWNKNDLVRTALYESGWNIHNPNLVETLKNYKTTVPPRMVYACQLQCWKEGPNVKYRPVSGE